MQHRIPLENNPEYFADYCHPLERVNQMIVDELSKIRLRDVFRSPSIIEIIKKSFGRKSKSRGEKTDIPKDTYTFY